MIHFFRFRGAALSVELGKTGFPVFVVNLKLSDTPRGLTEIDFQITTCKRDRTAGLSRPLLWQVLPWQHGYRLQRGDLVPVPPQSPIQSP